MKTTKTKIFLVTVIIVVVCVCAIVGYSFQKNNSQSGAVDVNDTSQGVAATVNGTEIGEAAVSAYIDKFRSSQGLDTPEAWAQWLVSVGETPEGIRTVVIDIFAEQVLMDLAAEEYGIVIDEALIDEQVAYMVEQAGSEEAWNQVLTSQGLTNQDYRDMVHYGMLSQLIMDEVAPTEEVSDEEILSAAPMFLDAYNGAKKSSHILFASDDKALAEEVLTKINNGEISFEDAVAQYSIDEGSKVDNGNVGWDRLSPLVPEYVNGLAPLNAGEVSDLVVSPYGIHIIKCTEVFVAPTELTSIDQIPVEFASFIKDQLIDYQRQMAYSTWHDEYKANASIVINDMPSDLPYDVDLTGVVVENPATPQSPEQVPVEPTE